MWTILNLLLACNSDTNQESLNHSTLDSKNATRPPLTQDAQQPQQNPTSTKPNLSEGNLDKGQQHPPIPADNPVWEWDAKAFVPDHGWFGEHNWYDVRMRVVGHLAMIYRDLARSYILQGNWPKAAETYEKMADQLEKIDTSKSDFAEKIRQLLIQRAKTDQMLINALTNKTPFPKEQEGLLALRIEYWQLIQNPSAEKAQNLQKKLEPYLTVREDLQIDKFENFTDRHHLRQRLFEGWAHSSDPLLPFDDRWGYWRPEEIPRQALALGLALSHLGGDDWTDKGQDWLIPFQKQAFNIIGANSIEDVDLTLLPSFYSKHLLDPHNKSQFTAEEFGRLPTGDSLIDVTGQPGPMGIGSLMKMDISDPTHLQWLNTQVNKFERALTQSPESAITVCNEAINYLDAQSFGSRFYNVKQFRNACTRQLASVGEYEAAAKIYAQSLNLHHQDWACPNRKALVLGVIGRLELQNGQIDQAQQTLNNAIQNSEAFLENVNLAMQGKLTEPRPPMFQPIQPKGNIKAPKSPNGKFPHTPGTLKGPPGNSLPSPPKHE